MCARLDPLVTALFNGNTDDPKRLDKNIFKKIDVDLSEPYFLFVGVLRYYKGCIS